MNRTPLSDIPVFHEKHKPTFDLQDMKRYYSSIDVEIYFGEIYIDEIVNLQFTVQQNAQPLYGYNSFVMDDLALGNRVISGSFVINFTSPQYLFKVLDDLSAMRGVKDPQIKQWGRKLGIDVEWDADRRLVVVDGVEFELGEVPGTRFEAEEGRHYVINEDTLLEAVGRGGAAEHRRAQSNRPLWDKTFDIDIVYGSKPRELRGPEARDMIIKDANVLSCMQQFDIQGEPVLEQYMFIARDIVPL